MNRRSLSYNWTEEDRRTSAQWGRGMAVFYTSIALLVLGVIALTKPSSVAPNEPGDRQTSSASGIAEPAAETTVATASAKSAPPSGRN